MPSAQQLLDDINLRYRNTFTTSQILVWFNEEQRELFDILELDSPPYTFQTVAGENFYPFPDQFDFTKIKSVTYQVDSTVDPQYTEIPFAANDPYTQSPYAYPWYTIVSDAMYLYFPTDTDNVGGRNVYIYCEADPTEVTTANLGVSPDLPTKFQELLKLGTLKRIAMARKDVIMYNNYNGDYEQKITDVLWEKKLAEPNWKQPADVMPTTQSNQPYGMVVGWPYWRVN